VTTDVRPNALIVRGWKGQPSVSELEEEAAAGERPRTPYVELAKALDADVIDADFLSRRGRSLSRIGAGVAGIVEGQVVETFLRRRRYQHVVAFADRIGLELALLFKLARSRRDLVLVSNWLMGASKRVFFERGRVQSHLGTIIGYGSVQLAMAGASYGFSPDQLHLVLQPVDEFFWQPMGDGVVDDLISAVGCVTGFRDYPTLIAATRDLDVRVQLAVGSLILSSDHKHERAVAFQRSVPSEDLPKNVSYEFDLPPIALRALYARSRFVVLPLENVDFDAGVTSITEAMAMGKAVIATRTRGQVDVLRDGVDGLYVPPKDPGALREAIEHLLANPAEAERMGQAGRTAVLERHRLDDWAATIARIVREAPGRRTT
jgi:glycosyltransferase involved in cell wall biosynthesis